MERRGDGDRNVRSRPLPNDRRKDTTGAMRADSENSVDGWIVVHRLPGRVRLRSGELVFNPELTAGVRKDLGSMPGVSRVEASDASGGVLVYFDEGRVGLASLLESARHASPLSAGSSNPSKPRRAAPFPARTSRPEAGENEGTATEVARTLRNLALDADAAIRKMTGGHLELKQIVLGFLLVRPAFIAAGAGVLSWSAIQAAIEFAVAWTLYENPGAAEEAQKAKSLASPLP